MIDRTTLFAPSGLHGFAFQVAMADAVAGSPSTGITAPTTPVDVANACSLERTALAAGTPKWSPRRCWATRTSVSTLAGSDDNGAIVPATPPVREYAGHVGTGSTTDSRTRST